MSCKVKEKKSLCYESAKLSFNMAIFVLTFKWKKSSNRLMINYVAQRRSYFNTNSTYVLALKQQLNELELKKNSHSLTSPPDF